jgi:hypothetical protein
MERAKKGPGRRKNPWMKNQGMGMMGRNVGMEGGGGYDREGVWRNQLWAKRIPGQGKAAGGLDRVWV